MVAIQRNRGAEIVVSRAIGRVQLGLVALGKGAGDHPPGAQEEETAAKDFGEYVHRKVLVLASSLQKSFRSCKLRALHSSPCASGLNTKDRHLLLQALSPFPAFPK